MEKTLIFIPTYNEAENIVDLIKRIFAINNDFIILIVDDNSPDGTALLVHKHYGNQVNIIIRKGERGRGLAGIYGFKEALKFPFEFLVEMDGDLSHSPEYIPSLLKEAKKNDLVIGSRFTDGGKDKSRGAVRRLVSFFARIYISIVLELKIKDITSGFRVFRRDVIEKILPHLTAKDPFIIAESLYWTNKYNFKIKEVPISFFDRIKGKSKLTPKILITYLWKVLLLRFKRY